MAATTTPVLIPGSIARRAQPTLGPSDGLVLRPWRDTDAPAVFAAFSDPLIRRWHARAAGSVAEAGLLLDGWRAAWESETGAQWAVAHPSTDEVLGRAALRHMDLNDGLAEVAYWTLPAARGRGVATEAVALLTRWALGTAGFHRLELDHAVGNSASCRVATKPGFAFEGTKRSAALHEDGWHDMHLHARVQGDPAPHAATATTSP